MKGAKRIRVVANSYKRFRAAWENRAKRQKCTTRMKTMRTTINEESTKSDEEEYSGESDEFAFADNLLF